MTWEVQLCLRLRTALLAMHPDQTRLRAEAI